MKQNRDIVVIGCLFFVVGILFKVVNFWGAVGLSDPKGFFIQGGLFLVLMLLFQNYIFKPFIQISQERTNQTDGKRKDAIQKQEKAQEMMREYEDAIVQAKIKALNSKQAIAMQAEEEERKTIEHARKVSDENLKKELSEIASQAKIVEKDLDKNVNDIANQIFDQVFSPQGGTTV